MEFSDDGQAWTPVASFSYPLTVSQVGVYGGNFGGTSAPAFEAAVDWFEVADLPIVVEDGSFPGSGPFTLDVFTAGTGSGSVTKDPDQATYTCSDVVTLTAIPVAGSKFIEWQGDLSGNTNPVDVGITSDLSVTAVFDLDFDPPIISNLTVSTTTTTALVTWDTDEPATSRVDYGLTASYGDVVEDLTYKTSHSIELIGLTPGTLYHYQVCSTDEAGNGPSCSADDTFTTLDLSGLVSDDFNHCEGLIAPWTYVDPIGDGVYDVTGVGTDDAWVLLHAPGGFDHEPFDTEMPARIVQPVMDTDFDFAVKFDSELVASIQQQGVLIEQDALNWLRFNVYRSGSKTWAYVASNLNGSTTTEANVEISLTAPVYLRVRRVVDDWTMFWSADPDTQGWVDVLTFTYPIFAAQVGIWGGNSGQSSAPAHTAFVDWFESASDPIVGEDGAFPGSGPFTLDVFTAGTGTGSVTKDPDQATYTCSDVVTLTAVPDPGSVFVEWQGDLGGSVNPEQVAMTSDKSITAVFGPDVTPPVISNVQVAVTATTALVTWDTDEPASSRVDYGLTSAYGDFVVDSTLVTAHSILITGLVPGTLYHYSVSSVNGAGLSDSTSDATFLTTELWSADSDDFNQCSGLSGIWTFVDPQADSSYVISGVGTDDAQLSISVPAGAEHQVDGVLTAPHVVQDVNDTDLAFEVKFESELTLGTQIQGVLIKQDDSNWLRFDFYSDGSEVYAYAGAIVNGVPTELVDVGLGALGEPLWMRVSRTGDLWTQRFSTNGMSWTTVLQDVTHVMTVSQAALYAGNASGASSPAHTAVLDYFFNLNEPIVPEDGAYSGDGPYTLTTVVDPPGQGAGTIVVVPDQTDYTCADLVEVSASPSAGWAFVGWSGDLSGITNPQTLPMTEDRSVTAHFAPDVDPPVISDVNVTPGATFATITWKTNEPADSQVDYGLTSSYTDTYFDPVLVTQHTVLLSGLDPSTTYHFQVCSADLGGLTSCEGDFTFTTVSDGGFLSDDFNHPNLNLGAWEWVDPSGGEARLRLVDTCTSEARIEIELPYGGYEFAPWLTNNAARIMQPVQNTDFEIELKMQTVLDSRYQIVGIVVEEDADTWLRFDCHHTGSQLRVYASVFDAGALVDERKTVISSGAWLGDPLWLRVQRVGDQWTQSYSFDGLAWFANESTLTFACVPTKAGVFAGNEEPPYVGLLAAFDYAFNAATPIEPEDQGCPSDGTVPFLYSALGRPVSDTAVRVDWATDERTSGEVRWGTTAGDYPFGPQSGQTLVYEDYAIISGLLPDTEYHLQITVQDGNGNPAVQSSDIVVSTGPPGFDGLPNFEVWYATPNAQNEPVLSFGQLGNPQQWVNILGNVTDDVGGEVETLTYSLNGGPDLDLSVEGVDGLDTWRLVEPGDFNVEIDYSTLLSGLNEVLLTATDNDQNVAQLRVWIDYTPGVVWSQPYSIDWSAVAQLEDVSQVVDGRWEIDSSGGTPRLRNSFGGVPYYGYDRLVAIGDEVWEDFEFVFDFEVHSLNPDGVTPGTNANAFGVIMRWPGHSPGTQQPHDVFFPMGMFMAYRWYSPTDEYWEGYGSDYSDRTSLPPFFMPVDLGEHYLLRGRCTTQPDGRSLYQLRLWDVGAPEPADWFFEILTEDMDEWKTGSLLLISHDVDCSIGNITITAPQ